MLAAYLLNSNNLIYACNDSNAMARWQKVPVRHLVLESLLESSQVLASTTPQIRYPSSLPITQHFLQYSYFLCHMIVIKGSLPPRLFPMSEDLSD